MTEQTTAAAARPETVTPDAIMQLGCAEGAVPGAVARAYEHLTGGGFDLPPLEPIFNAYVARFGLADRLSFTPGDFLADPLPRADVLIMGTSCMTGNSTRSTCSWRRPTTRCLTAEL
jgi:hypothetical protein